MYWNEREPTIGIWYQKLPPKSNGNFCYTIYVFDTLSNQTLHLIALSFDKIRVSHGRWYVFHNHYVSVVICVRLPNTNGKISVKDVSFAKEYIHLAEDLSWFINSLIISSDMATQFVMILQQTFSRLQQYLRMFRLKTADESPERKSHCTQNAFVPARLRRGK